MKTKNQNNKYIELTDNQIEMILLNREIDIDGKSVKYVDTITEDDEQVMLVEVIGL